MKKQMKMNKKVKRYDDGGYVDDEDSGFGPYATMVTDDDGEVAYQAEERMPRSMAPVVRKAARTEAARRSAVQARKASEDYSSAARNKYMEARGYDEASKNKSLSSEDRRAMLGRYTKAMNDYDTLGRASKYAESKGMKKGGSVSSASKRADGCAQRGKTKGRLV